MPPYLSNIFSTWERATLHFKISCAMKVFFSSNVLHPSREARSILTTQTLRHSALFLASSFLSKQKRSFYEDHS